MISQIELKQIIDQAIELSKLKIMTGNPAFQNWKNRLNKFLEENALMGTAEYDYLKKIDYSYQMPGLWPGSKKFDNENISACRTGLQSAVSILNTLLDKQPNDNSKFQEIGKSNNFSSVFIVHGHDGELKESVARIIEKQGIEAIILSEKANQGRTIIEKFEDYSDVGGAICLFTADDVGNVKAAEKYNSRARQNVIFETGYFMGKLGRDHVVILADQGVEMPSDLSGVVYTNTASWQFELLKEMNAIGYQVDMNKLLE